MVRQWHEMRDISPSQRRDRGGFSPPSLHSTSPTGAAGLCSRPRRAHSITLRRQINAPALPAPRPPRVIACRDFAACHPERSRRRRRSRGISGRSRPSAVPRSLHFATLRVAPVGMTTFDQLHASYPAPPANRTDVRRATSCRSMPPRAQERTAPVIHGEATQQWRLQARTGTNPFRTVHCTHQSPLALQKCRSVHVELPTTGSRTKPFRAHHLRRQVVDSTCIMPLLPHVR
jgi:hypothetical protein